MPALKKRPAKEDDPASEISIQEKFKLARAAMATALVERDDEIDLVLTSLIANENPLLIGSPGSAKTRLYECLAKWIDGPQFYYLLTKFTDPGEIFGPVDIVALTKERRTSRVVEGYAPTSVLLAFDEVFKASSAILNCTLTLLNERRVKFGKQEISCPLVLCIGMSNEWPSDDNGGKELGALFDRFLFRKSVHYVTKTGRKALLGKAVANDPCRPSFPCMISPQEIHQAHTIAMGLPWTDDAKRALWDILEGLNREGIFPGDRRIFKSVGAARASAYLNGGDAVQPEHLEVLMHVLWDDPEEQPLKCEKVVARIANPHGMKVMEIHQNAMDVENEAEKALSGTLPAHNREGTIQGVLTKLGEYKTELRVLAQDVRRDKVMDYIDDAIKTWQYKLVNLTRS